jgi:hypothetical protein
MNLFLYLTDWLVLRERLALENYIIANLVKKFLTFYGNLRFITAMASGRHDPYPEPIHPVCNPPPPNILTPLGLSSCLHLGFPSGHFSSCFRTECAYTCKSWFLYLLLIYSLYMRLFLISPFSFPNSYINRRASRCEIWTFEWALSAVSSFLPILHPFCIVPPISVSLSVFSHSFFLSFVLCLVRFGLTAPYE